MTQATRILMLASWVLLTLLLLLFVVFGLKGNSSAIYELIDLPSDLPAAPLWAVCIAGAFFAFGSAALGSVFWAAHSMMRRAKRSEFLYLARCLERCAWSLVCFWLSYALILGVLPAVLLTSINLNDWPPLDWFPIDPEITFLVIAFPLFTISASLKQAAAIEEENRQFL